MEEQLLKYLNKLKEKAVNAQPKKKLEELYKCYSKGSIEDNLEPSGFRDVSPSNVLKSIVDTVATFVLDNQLTKEVVLRQMSFADVQTLEDTNDKASVLNDCLQDVVDQNNDKLFQRDIVLSMLIYGVGISKTYWAQESEDDLGEVKYESINPCHFYPDPSATDIPSCNYIFIKRKQSIFDLINKYKNNPEMIEKIKNLKGDAQDNQKTDSKSTPYRGTFQNDTMTGTAFIGQDDYDSKYDKTNNNLTIWECYLKDDTIFVDPEGDDDDSLKMQRLMYPNGRVITYCGNTVLEDKAIDYPFGFPFDIIKNNFSPDSFWGPSLVSYLKYPQKRLDSLNIQIRRNLNNDYNLTMIDPWADIKKEDLTENAPIIYTEQGALRNGNIPIAGYNNGILNTLPILEHRLEILEQDMYNIARVNKMMISGERPVGVNSGRMVEDLIESPMSSIREQQRSMVELNVNLSNKVVTLIQLYYRAQRIVRLSTGDFIQISPDTSLEARFEQQGGNMMTIQKTLANQARVEGLAIDIKTDLSAGEFETKIIAGSEMPLSRTQIAQITTQMLREGFFQPVDIDAKEFYLDQIDFPNYRAIIQKMRDAKEEADMSFQEEMANNPTKQFLLDLESADIKPKEILATINNIQDENLKSNITIELLSRLGLAPQPLPVDSPLPLSLMQEEVVTDTIY